jgi:hypothetical protein
MPCQAAQACDHRLVIAGNHDQLLQVMRGAFPPCAAHALTAPAFVPPSPQDAGPAAAAQLLPHCTYLCHHQHSAAGLRFLASPYSRGNSPNCAFQGKERCAAGLLLRGIDFHGSARACSCLRGGRQSCCCRRRRRRAAYALFLQQRNRRWLECEGARVGTYSQSLWHQIGGTGRAVQVAGCVRMLGRRRLRAHAWSSGC